MTSNVMEEACLFCSDINSYIKEVFGYRKSHANTTSVGCIDVRTKKVDLYLRYKPSVKSGWGNTLVIARIEFSEVRVGNGTLFLRELVNLAAKYGYENIGIEAAGPDGIVAFAVKYGFKRHPNGSGNWLVTVEDLKTILAKNETVH